MAKSNKEVDRQIDRQKDRWHDADRREKSGEISKEESERRKKEAHEEAEKIRREAGRSSGGHDGTEDKDYRGKYSDRDNDRDNREKSDRDERQFTNLRGSQLTDFANDNEGTIRDIARKHNVDMGVAKEMFETDIYNDINRVGDGSNRYGDFEISENLKNSYKNAYEHDISNMDENNYRATEAALKSNIDHFNKTGDTNQVNIINNHLDNVRSLIDPNYKPGEEFKYPGEENVKAMNTKTPLPSRALSSSLNNSKNIRNREDISESIDDLINTLIENNTKISRGKNPYKRLDLGYDRSRERQRDDINDRLTDVLVDTVNKEHKPLTETEHYKQFKKGR